MFSTVAGFDVMETRGIWLVRDPVTKRPFDLFSCKAGELDCDFRAGIQGKGVILDLPYGLANAVAAVIEAPIVSSYMSSLCILTT